MGVSLYITETGESTSMKYSGLSKLREMLVLAATRYLQSHDHSHELASHLGGWIVRPTQADNKWYNMIKEYKGEEAADMWKMMKGVTNDGINYERVPRPNSVDVDLFNRCGLIGLYRFVAHSDNDGTHSAGDCVDISVMFNKLRPYIEFTKGSEDWEPEWVAEVDSFFQHAVEATSGVYYS